MRPLHHSIAEFVRWATADVTYTPRQSFAETYFLCITGKGNCLFLVTGSPVFPAFPFPSRDPWRDEQARCRGDEPPAAWRRWSSELRFSVLSAYCVGF